VKIIQKLKEISLLPTNVKVEIHHHWSNYQIKLLSWSGICNFFAIYSFLQSESLFNNAKILLLIFHWEGKKWHFLIAFVLFTLLCFSKKDLSTIMSVHLFKVLLFKFLFGG